MSVCIGALLLLLDYYYNLSACADRLPMAARNVYKVCGAQETAKQIVAQQI